MKNSKKILFSGIQPSGNLHIGNYLGAILKWIELQASYECIFCVVDYHAITMKQNPVELKKRIIEIAKIYLAAGVDPKKAIIFQQSDVAAHTELGWILNTVARVSDLKKMTQFKDKAGKNGENVSVGLFDYPVLMAADILLYDTDAVPVGDDQSQHVELARDLAKRFNYDFSEVFKIPELIIRKEGSRIMGLDSPAKKMSKSASNPANYIALLEDPKAAAKKIMRAMTDSDNEVKYSKENKPAISNLLTIFSLLSGKKIKSIEKDYIGKGYGDFKKDLAAIVEDFLTDFQAKYNAISDDDVIKIMAEGAEMAKMMADKKLLEVKKAIGVK